MSSQAKQAKLARARAQSRIAKRRARYKKVLEKYRGNQGWGDHSADAFDSMIAELSLLNVKYLSQLLIDVEPGFSGVNNKLIHAVELLVIERTILK